MIAAGPIRAMATRATHLTCYFWSIGSAGGAAMRDIAEFRERNAFSDDAYLQSALARMARDLAARQGGRLAAFGQWVAAEADPAAAYSDHEAPPRLVEALEGG